MAPATHSHSRQPSKEKEEKEEPSSEEEETEEEGESEEDPSEEEKENPPHEEDEEEPSSEDEEDHQPIGGKKTPIPVVKSDDKHGSGSGSESESESDGGSPSDYKLQPVVKTPKPAGKRTHKETGNDKQSLASSKKSRIEEKKSSSTSTPGPFTRLWSNEDEIAVLNGMLEFRDARGIDPSADMGAFHNFVKGELMVDYSKEQLRTKIKGMKKRFLNAVKRGENGADPVFSKPHEVMAFELSKKIWGGDGEGSKDVVANRIHENGKKDIVKAKKKILGNEKDIVTKEKDEEEGDFWSRYPFLSNSFGKMVGNFPSLAMPEASMSFLKERLSLIENAKAKELNEKWKKLVIEENEMNYKMLALMKEQVRMAFDL